jgi:hypothetical protein
MFGSYERACSSAHADAVFGEREQRSTRDTRVVLVLAAVLAAAAFSAASAGAKVVTDALTHKKFGIVPTTNARPAVGAACNADNTDCTKLTYGGGPVQHAEKDYLFFWTPPGHGAPSAYRVGMSTWLNEIAAADYRSGNPLGVDQQYYDNSGPGGRQNFVPYAVTNGGTLIDTAAYPASGCSDDGMPVCLTDAQLEAQLSSYVSAHHLPTGINTEYFIMTPVGVGSCFDSGSSSCAYTAFCGYHSALGSGSSQILYADMPWAFNVSGCDVNLAFGAGYANADGIDPVVGIFSHELSETMTDPNPGTGWTQTGGTDAGYEIGDKCAYIYGTGGYGSLTGLSNNGLGYWNVALATDQYLMQMEFDNRLSNCAVKDTDIQPAATLTVTPNPPAHGSSATLTAKITDTLGVAYVQWSFGDGGSATTQGTACTGTSPVVCSTTHTYATAHPSPGITASAIVTDAHGNENKASLTFTVS